MTDDKGVAHARAIANDIRTDWPEKAAQIDQAVAEVEAGQRDRVSVSVDISFKLEKFDAATFGPGAKPYEVIEGTG